MSFGKKNPAMQTILVLGGAQSGKSSFAERLASTLSSEVSYIATAKPVDLEMSNRIQRHQLDRETNVNSVRSENEKNSSETRKTGLFTIEEPIELVSALDRLPDGAKTVVVDCLTV